ncbi:MAG TPA: hypothetical protein VHU84_09685 [Lacipirellulaceae bacterium]|nr:hypothetical protein [Lacipirellulaceae bacterium]
MKHRKLRIVWSVVWGIAAVLLVVLWVRSYSRVEHTLWNSARASFCISTYPGEVTIEATNGGVLMPLGWSHVVFPISGNYSPADDEPRTIFGFAWQTDDDSIIAYIPFWFLTLICAAFTWFGIVPPHIVKRFSLRTLLIATTLVAVGLWLIVWAVR